MDRRDIFRLAPDPGQITEPQCGDQKRDRRRPPALPGGFHQGRDQGRGGEDQHGDQ